MSIFVKEKKWLCPLECPMSILLICPDILKQVIVFEYLYAHPPVRPQRWAVAGGGGGPDHAWLLPHSSRAFLFFLYNSPYVVYNPKLVPGEENNPYFVLDSQTAWICIFEMNQSVVFSFCLLLVGVFFWLFCFFCATDWRLSTRLTFNFAQNSSFSHFQQPVQIVKYPVSPCQS